MQKLVAVDPRTNLIPKAGLGDIGLADIKTLPSARQSRIGVAEVASANDYLSGEHREMDRLLLYFDHCLRPSMILVLTNIGVNCDLVEEIQ